MLTSLGTSHPNLSVVPTGTPSLVWVVNLLGTIAFPFVHLFIVGLVFYKYFVPVDYIALLWSALQLSLVLYSYLILFGTVPLQITMLYLMVPIRLIIFIMLSTPAITTVMELLAVGWANSYQELSYSALSLAYQAIVYIPSFLFMVPLLVYMYALDVYMAAKYPTLYKQIIIDSTITNQIKQYLQDLTSQSFAASQLEMLLI